MQNNIKLEICEESFNLAKRQRGVNRQGWRRIEIFWCIVTKLKETSILTRVISCTDAQMLAWFNVYPHL